MLKEKLEQIKQAKANYDIAIKKNKKIVLIAFIIEALIVGLIFLLRALKVVTEENEYIVYILICISSLALIVVLLFTGKKEQKIDFEYLWFDAVMQDRAHVLELDDSSAKIIIDMSISEEGKAVYIYRKDKITPKIIIKKANARVAYDANEEPITDDIFEDDFFISPFCNWFSVYYYNKLNQGKYFSSVSIYTYFDIEDKNLSDEDTLWETIVKNGELSKEAVSNVKIANMR